VLFGLIVKLLKMKAVYIGKFNEERREFLKKTGTFTAYTLAGIGFLSACEKEDNAPQGQNEQPVNEKEAEDAIVVTATAATVDLSKLEALKSAGAWLLISQARLLVVNLGNNNFKALSSVCTHQGCSDSWNFANNLFICTCHNSRFRTDGTVENGPASSPLRVFQTAVANDVLTITL